MKKLLALLAMVLAFTLASVAQYGSSSTSAQSEPSTASKAKSQKATGSSNSKKEETVTGCLSAQPNARGNYILTNDNYKRGVKVGPADKVKAHAGHTVELSGQWTGKAGGKSFEVASVKHVATTCK